MRLFLLILALVTLQNYANASDALNECIAEQVELIEENRESYTQDEIDKQYNEVSEYCKLETSLNNE